MKTVAKIDPEKEYEIAKNLIELASQKQLDSQQAGSLDSSVDNLITAARVLMEREERRRGASAVAPNNPSPKGRKNGETREESNKLPSKRFPNLEIHEEILPPDHLPVCNCCQSVMKQSGLFEVSEKIEVIPKQYYIRRIKRVKFNCSTCYGSLVTASPAQSIVPSSNYGDSLIIDVALSKFCDLIPIERYVQMAKQMGIDGDLPPQSLIGLTHHLANFLQVIYEKIKLEVQSSIVLQADETPHKMLEGDDTKNWYFWGFFSSTACYFEAHGTRSGDVATNFLKDSSAKFFLTDGYSGYGKALREIEQQFDRHIDEAHCNAHAYRYFEEASITWKDESEIFLKLYGQIYELERERKESNANSEDQLKFRTKMIPLFEEIKTNCQEQSSHAMAGSQLLKAMNYFLNHYEGLTICLTNLAIPLDNNLAERELRAPVIGRKTWLGTHSKRGALTTAVLFSIVQSCKLNKVNPRSYFPWIVKQIHMQGEILTPHQYLIRPGTLPETQ
jgi:transposase